MVSYIAVPSETLPERQIADLVTQSIKLFEGAGGGQSVADTFEEQFVLCQTAEGCDEHKVVKLFLQHHKQMFARIERAQTEASVVAAIAAAQAAQPAGTAPPTEVSHAVVAKSLKDKAEKEVEGFFGVCCHLITHLESMEAVQNCSEQLQDVVTGETATHVELRVKLMMLLYNTFREGTALRHPIFMRLLQYCSDVGQVEMLMNEMLQLEREGEGSIVAEWAPTMASPALSMRELYLTLATALLQLPQTTGSSRRDQAYKFLKKYGQSMQGCSKAELGAEECQRATAQLVREAAVLDSVLLVDDLLRLDAVNVLRNGPNVVLVKLLDLLHAGTLAELTVLAEKHPDFFGDGAEQVDLEACKTKLRLLSLASMGKGRTELPLDEVWKALDVDRDEVEAWLVKLISSGVVDGRIDQARGVLLVKSAVLRRFQKTEWQQLKEKLAGWKDNVKSISVLMQQQEQAMKLQAAAARQA